MEPPEVLPASLEGAVQTRGVCEFCVRFDFIRLPAESEIAKPHLPSLKDLEMSAQSCAICSMILDAGRLRLEQLNDSSSQSRPYLYTALQGHPEDEFRENEKGGVLPDIWAFSQKTVTPTRLSTITVDLGHEKGNLTVRPWLYGNYYRPSPNQDNPQFIGIGVRLSPAPGPELVRKGGNKHLSTTYMGSYIRVCTNDGIEQQLHVCK